MSLHAYQESKRVARYDFSFEALIMAAMRKADTRNSETLRAAFPDTWNELQQRYHAPAGLLSPDEDLTEL